MAPPRKKHEIDNIDASPMATLIVHLRLLFENPVGLKIPPFCLPGSVVVLGYERRKLHDG